MEKEIGKGALDVDGVERLGEGSVEVEEGC